jgi:hypothetical protein
MKTIDNKEPVYYRLVNMNTFDIQEIPAYKILDTIINNNMQIINAKCVNNKLMILDDEGYESTDEIIVIDEFDEYTPSIFDWAIRNEGLGSEIMKRFNSEKNKKSLGEYSIDSRERLIWTCKKGHTIHCGFPSYYSMKCECPMCLKKTPSFRYWANMMNRLDLIEAYEKCSDNELSTSEIAYNSKRKVRLLITNTDTEAEIEVYEPLCKITKGLMSGDDISEQLKYRLDTQKPKTDN